MSRRSRIVAVVVVLAAAVAGVVVYLQRDAADPFAAYCGVVEKQQRTIGAALSAGPTTGLLRALPAFEKLRDAAPDDIRDEWGVVVSRIVDLRDALTDAGVEPASFRLDKPPVGLDPAKEEAIQTAAVRLGAKETAIALAGVQQQARDVCKTPLSL